MVNGEYQRSFSMINNKIIWYILGMKRVVMFKDESKADGYCCITRRGWLDIRLGLVPCLT